uniref:Cytochrome c oxidase assembly protein COX16 homolog, mitochondrial n=1 Tax=Saccoglossus kowalevskii TaxID=10224 RepID=A0ABM0GJV4_SACKO|nr:PREDICTED: cytochrome c oxidase assembly protein COX16 homolog, mitochondrial-like [Saccoglossus kowalevskii]
MAAPIASTIRKYAEAITKNKFLRHGLPMLLLIVGGSFGLKEFSSLRYETRYIKKIDPELEATMKKGKKKITLDEELEKIQEKDLDKWVNIRGPRPWEDSKQVQDEQRKRLSKQT